MRLFRQIFDYIISIVYPANFEDQVLIEHLSNYKIHIRKINNLEVTYFYKYTGVARQAILRFKYRHLHIFADFFSNIIVDYLIDYITEKGVWGKNKIAIVYIPMHKFNKIRRKRDHMEILYNLVISKLIKNNILLNHGVKLIRKRVTKPQNKLSKYERSQNLKDAFVSAGSFNGITEIIIIDDICTTGATLKAATLSLKKKNKHLKIKAITMASTYKFF